jgi:hypothetical protein
MKVDYSDLVALCRKVITQQTKSTLGIKAENSLEFVSTKLFGISISTHQILNLKLKKVSRVCLFDE